MENIKSRLKDDMKSAMKNKENFKRDVIRFIQSSIKQVEIDNRIELKDDEVIKIIQKLLKQRVDASKQFKDARRMDLVEKEEAEAKILQEYLPKQMSDEELKAVVEDIIKQCNATSMKDIGKVMGIAMKKCEGKADGSKISAYVKEILG